MLIQSHIKNDFLNVKVLLQNGCFGGVKKFVLVTVGLTILVVFMFTNALNVIEGINIVITLEDILLSVQVRRNSFQ